MTFAATEHWGLPAIRPSTVPTPDDLASRRAAAASLPPVAADDAVNVRSERLGGVPCMVCTPPRSRRVALYFHGGGYRLGSAERSAPFGTRLAAAMDAVVVIADYRLAPEHPFPAALHDAADIYRHLLEEGQGPPLLVGDSAGGGLAAALTVAAMRAGVPAPCALIAMSPWLDLTCTAGTYRSRAQTDQLFSLAAARQAAEMYLQGHDAKDPLASPLLAAPGHWPRTLLLASTEEVLLDDSGAFGAALAQAGVAVATHFEPGVPHAWPAVVPDLPESAAALATIGHFTTHLGR